MFSAWCFIFSRGAQYKTAPGANLPYAATANKNFRRRVCRSDPNMVNTTLVDSLVDIPINEWSALREKFRENFPYGVTGSNALRSSFLNKTKIPDFPVSVCAPFGNTDDGFVCLWNQTDLATEIGIYLLGDEKEKLVEALIKSKRIEWEKRVLFCCVMPNLVQAVYDIINAKGLKYGVDETYIAFIEKEKALAFDTTPPADVKLVPSTLEHTPIMDSVWPHRYPGSLIYFQKTVGWGASLALLGQAGDLRGWVLSSVRGDMHAVHVLEDHRRKGYAQLLLRVLGKQHAESDKEVFGCIVTQNSSSKEMFQKMGFKNVVITSWIFTL